MSDYGCFELLLGWSNEILLEEMRRSASLSFFQLNFQQLLLRDSSLKEESLFDSENFFVPLFEVILQQSGIILFKGRLRLFYKSELVTMRYNAFVNNFELTLNYIDLNERCDQIPKKIGGFTAISCLET